MTEFSFIDLFAGIGGLRIGFEGIGGTCVFTSEWDKFAQRTYRANFDDDHEINGDITEIDERDIPAHDVLLAGFPCQPFSLAGIPKKKLLGHGHGFADKTQGTLFFDIVRILRHHKPKAFLLENVKNLKSHDKGNTFRVILQALDELGYVVDHRIIDAKHWVPQHRERIFIAGFRRDLAAPFSFDDVILPKGPAPILADILHPEDGSENAEEPYTTGAFAEVADKYTMTNKMWTWLQEHTAKHKAAGNGFSFSIVDPNSISRTLTARYHKDGNEIMVAQGSRNPRRLTPRECARLMGFDHEDWAHPWEIVVSDTQAYRQFGNAVVPLVSLAIAEAMAPSVFGSRQ